MAPDLADELTNIETSRLQREALARLAPWETIMPHSDLINAYRYHRNWRRAAALSLELARKDVASGRRRYPAETSAAVSWQKAQPIGNLPFPQHAKHGLACVQSIEGAGLRFVGNVEADTPRGQIWANRETCGWYTDPAGDTFKDGSGLCWGVVYQLPARDGKARFVAGYIFGGCSHDLPTIDFGTIYESESARGLDCRPQDHDDAIDAARAADSMAQHAAEEERDYQAAYAAGSRFAELGDELKAARDQVRELLADRRKARQISPDTFPSICSAIRQNVRRALADIQAAREERRKLAEGDHVAAWLPGWWTGDKRLQAAFNEGAGIRVDSV